MKPNEHAAYQAGRNGYPAPSKVSHHNYSDGEQAAWERGRQAQ